MSETPSPEPPVSPPAPSPPLPPAPDVGRHRSQTGSSEHPDAYTAGYMQGVAEAGAVLVGRVAGELGPDHPLVDRLVVRLGSLVPDVELELDPPNGGPG